MTGIVVLIVVLTIVILIILCYSLKTKIITESLLVSPVKLYSSSDASIKKICEINNNNQNQNETPRTIIESEDDSVEVYGYADYITISEYMSIKNKNPLLRAGRELIGKKVRILLPMYSKETVPASISEEETSYCSYSSSIGTSNYSGTDNNPLVQSEEESRKSRCSNTQQNNTDSSFNRTELENLNNQSSCAIGADEYSSLETESDDKTFAFSDYYLVQGEQCWYDVNIINYSMTDYPCSMHKIQWKNQQDVVESKWVSLHDFDIEVPIEPHNIYFKNEIGNSSGTDNPYYFWRTELEVSDEEDTLQGNCATPVTNNLSQNAYLNKNYFGNISCSNNQDCHKYGSLYCDGGYCSTKYIHL